MAKENLNIKCNILAFGGSAGSLDTLFKILMEIKSPISFAMVIILHRKNYYDSTLSDLLATKTIIPIKEVEDKDVLKPGNIYLAPADYHLLLEKDYTFSLDISEKVNFSRPSIDVTFESIAEIFGSGAIAILLSGANADGTKGLNAITQSGGTTVVQNPISAKVPFMPKYAIDHAKVDFIFTLPEIINFINSLNK